MDCVSQVALGSSEYLGQVFKRACNDRVPLCGGFDLTHRCNFRCVHCYAGHLVGQSRAQAAELTTKEVTDLLEAAADAGCLLMLLSGGEPLLREDFIDIYKAARRLGLIVTVFTNASLLTERHLDAFAEFPPHSVEVSVYGATEATHQRVTGVPGALKLVHRGIEGLLRGGVRVTLKTMILRDNVDEVLAIEEWARDLGVGFRLDPVVTPRFDGDPRPLDQRVEAETAVAIELASESRRAEVAEFIGRQRNSGETETLPADHLYRCGAGIASFHLDPLGYLYPCLMSRTIAYNALAMGFGHAWEAVTSAVDQAKWEGVGGCAECPNIILCGYCPGLFELEKTTPARPPEYVCRLGENRYRTIDANQREVVGVRTI
jgi:radical SAM protein with 4Fe4S-binding SPASM domain